MLGGTRKGGRSTSWELDKESLAYNSNKRGEEEQGPHSFYNCGQHERGVQVNSKASAASEIVGGMAGGMKANGGGEQTVHSVSGQSPSAEAMEVRVDKMGSLPHCCLPLACSAQSL